MSDELVEDLRASYDKLGPIHKVIKTQFGVASGNTRLLAVPTWPVIEKPVKTMYEHLQIEVAANLHDDKPASWWEEKINAAAKELVKTGTKPEEVSQRLLKDFPLSEKKILRYLHEEFKHPEKVRAGKVSAEARRGIAPMPPIRSPVRAGFSLQSTAQTFPILASEYRRRTYTDEELMLQRAFSGKGFDLNFQFPVPMDKWKCGKCRSTWIEQPPLKCPKDGTTVERLSYKVDILATKNRLKFAIEPGEIHDFDSTAKRDEFLKQNGITAVHVDNAIVRSGAWLVVAYVELLAKLGTYEEHTIAFEGYARHVALDTETVLKEAELYTQTPAHVRIIVRSK